MTISLATTCAVAWAVIAGTGVADAATRFRSGAVHAQLLDATSRIAPNGAASGKHVTTPDVMAAFVALMAVVAMLFLVVTLIRRRTSVVA
jgi:hypothetical protein